MTIAMRGNTGGETPQDPNQTQQAPQQPPGAKVPTTAAGQPAQTPSAKSGDPPATEPIQNPGGQSTDSSPQQTAAEEGNFVELVGDEEPKFPHEKLASLDEMISRPRWVVPVLPKGELELLLEASIDLCKKDLDMKSEACQRFFREGLTISFTKILTDEAVSGWKYEIHRCILKNAEKLIELCVEKLDQDWFSLLELLAMVLNPACKFHTYNGSRSSETIPSGVVVVDDELFARPIEVGQPKGWLVDLVNLFGKLNGFQIVHDRFMSGQNLTVPVIAALIKPFGVCYEVLTPHCIQKYFMPIIESVPKFLDNLTDEELNKETKNEAKNDALSGIIKSLKCLSGRVPKQEEKIKNLEIFRLKMILRLLQISSFNGKMNALNEVNKVIANVSFYHRHNQEEEEWLTAEKMAEWIQQNNVLSIVLRDSLHQPQYVEKLEKIIRFMIKEKSLTLQDLDKIWEAQAGKHEAIEKNVHDLLAKLAWDFSPEQLDHLFECFQASWVNASKKQREKLLELIRRLAEDDKEGVMAHKVLGLLWNLAHSEDVPTDITDQALSAHIKILDYSCSQVSTTDRDSQKKHWIDRFVDELKNDKWVIPALKQIKDICQLFAEPPQNFTHTQHTPHISYRNSVINQLQNQHSIVMLVAQNLTSYMNKARQYDKEHPDADPANILPDGRYNHIQQVQERLRFLRFLLKDGQLWLCEPQAKQIWVCLAEHAIYPCDRENCFRWFSKLMGEEPDLDPEITKDFFEQNILQFDPSLLTEHGINCFERFFKQVNSKERKLIPKRRGGYAMDDMNLIGIEYLWRVVLHSPDEVAEKAIILLKECYTNLSPRLHSNQVDMHDDLVELCVDHLKAAYDTISALDKDTESLTHIYQEANRMIRVMTVLEEYVAECDEAYVEERAILPLGRACRGKTLTLPIRFPNMNRLDDIDILSHTNETMGSVRRHVTQTVRERLRNQNVKVDLYVNGEIIDQNEDRKLVSQLEIRDKTLITGKVSPVGTNMPSSPDSSSDSSTGSPHNMFDDPNIEAENGLPGVRMSNSHRYASFLFQLADLGSQLQIPRLQESARQFLKLMPPDVHTVRELRRICQDRAENGDESTAPPLDDIFFGTSPSAVLYNLEVTYAQLMPALCPTSEEAFEFQVNFMKSGGVGICLSMLTKNNFLPSADLQTRRSAYLVVLKVVKLLLTAMADAQYEHIASSCQGDASKISTVMYNQGILLHQALECVPNPNSERMTRMVAFKLGKFLKEKILGSSPDLATVKAIQKIAWTASTGSLDLVHTSMDEIHRGHDKACTDPTSSRSADQDDIAVCREALEVLTVCLVVCPQALEALNKDKAWQTFIIDLLLLCKSRFVRMCASEQFYMMATRCCSGQRPLLFFITLLFTVLGTTAKEYAKQSHDYFQLLCRLLNYACMTQASLPTAEALLTNEICWLKKVKDSVLKNGDVQVEESLLEGHLGITKELLSLQTSEKKYQLGAEEGGNNLIQELMEDFLFPASKIVIASHKSKGDMPSDQAVPVCTTPVTIVAAFDLLVALCSNCVPNLKMVAEMLHEMYYSGNDYALVEWEYMPPVGPRPMNGFVGLKNAGATCYMNSVLQQLFMVDPIRSYILAAEGAADDGLEDEEEKLNAADNQSNVDAMATENEAQVQKLMTSSKGDERKDYNINVLKYVQLIFSHLACSKLQYYVPMGFWKHFRLWGEPVNLREQHDALEFFNSLVDSLDEALKALGYTPVLSKVMGGSFADQKICKGCPHRYSREESFTTLNIDIRNQQNLLESLEQYVKGDLLEGANAYHCEKCNKKVDTVKRLCIKKLPPILAIQLKRFDYDWERECAIKFNDYFEFPRELDMEPYTVQGLAKIEGEYIADDEETVEEKLRSSCTKYKLVGVVVHSGQASGGHYYSYILHRHGNQPPKWYKFDDGEVSECKMEDDEEMKNQCFGGEYLGEVFDHMMKRMSLRRQKRWWNAYILFYEREDGYESDVVKEMTKSIEDLTLATKASQYKMPAAIEKCVRKQNIQFMHNKNQFSVEYFQFMRKLLLANVPYVQLPAGQDKLTPESEDLAMISVQLAAKFLFSIGFHTKKTLRGPANEWYEALTTHLRHSKSVRLWFAQNVLFSKPTRFAEYLLESPSSEVRNAFMRIAVFLAHFCMNDGPCPPSITPVIALNDPSASLSDHILVAVLALLKKEVSEHGRHLPQYFHLFYMYANLGVPQKQQLLKLGIPSTFMQVALDEGPGPPIKYQYADLSKLYSVVSTLVRCCDVSQRCQSSVAGQPPLPNCYFEQTLKQPLMTIQPEVADILFSRPNYVKKLLEDCNNTEETAKLLRFCSWENPHFSSTVLSELLWQVAYSYTYELRPYLDLLLQMLLLEDSWQNHRIHNALKGIPDDRDGLFDTIQHSKSQHQKRAYQCIKMMVKLFMECTSAQQMLQNNVDLKRKWTWAVEWLNDELEKRPYSGNTQYSYSSWSPPAQSNETSNGYFLERSHSARMTLTKACELCPEEEPEEPEYSEEPESPQTDDTVTQYPTTPTGTGTTGTGTTGTGSATPGNQATSPARTATTPVTTTQPEGPAQTTSQAPDQQSPASSPLPPQQKVSPTPGGDTADAKPASESGSAPQSPQDQDTSEVS